MDIECLGSDIITCGGDTKSIVDGVKEACEDVPKGDETNPRNKIGECKEPLEEWGGPIIEERGSHIYKRQ